MPFVSPTMFGSNPLYPARIRLDPVPGTGTAGGFYLQTCDITILQDVKDDFGTVVNLGGDLNYAPFTTLQQYTFTLIYSTLTLPITGIQSLSLIEYDQTTTSISQTVIMELYNSTDGILDPDPVQYTPDVGGFSGLGLQMYTGAGGSRTLNGYVDIGIIAS